MRKRRPQDIVELLLFALMTLAALTLFCPFLFPDPDRDQEDDGMLGFNLEEMNICP